jgi:uncharacterized protein YdeI (YjbR/CyaY-like superfamily)
MAANDPRIDAYIKGSADFARPILEHLRQLIHKACPDVVETIKWSRPFFEYKGSVLCHIDGFKQHCAFGFWNAPLLKDPAGVLHLKDRKAMGHLDRITSLKDLPSDKILSALIKEAALLAEQGVKMPSRAAKKEPKADLPMPVAFAAALKKNKKAQVVFEGFPPSHRREYIEWIAEAKTDATRDKRIATTLEWLIEGKSRNWKYEKK